MVSDEAPRDAERFGPGAQIAGYLLEEEIGRGGMAVVYRAHDARLDRRVALKIMAPGLASDQGFRRRFIRESRAAAAVDHPNIVPIFEAGEASGALFIAMRYVQGRDLRTLLDREGTLPAAHVAHIIAQMASALDAAHAHGLVHRDVKPANMLLDEAAGRDQHDHVYLSDFGLSKQSLAVTDLTSAGQFLGTLDYVAPEQIEGRPVDGRTDLYALACAAFEMMSGAPPFDRGHRMAVLWAQLSEPPPVLTASRPDLPAAIDQVMAKALAKSPDGRYTSCLDFAAALRAACRPGAGDSAVFGMRPSPGAVSAMPPKPPRPATEVAMPARGSGEGVDDRVGAGGGAVDDRPGRDAAGPGAEGTPAAGTPAAGTPAARVSRPAGTYPDEPPSSAGPATEAASLPQTRSAGTGRDPGANWGADEQPGAGTRKSGGEGWGPGEHRDAGGGRAGRADRDPRAGWSSQERRDAGDGSDIAAGVGGAAGPPFRPGPPGPAQPPFPAPNGRPPDRPWMRSRAALAVACAAVVGLAGAVFAVHAAGRGQPTATRALAMPGCSTAVAAAKPLADVHRAMVTLPGQPYAVEVTPGGHWSFVTLGNAVAVMSNGGSLAPSLVRTIPVASSYGESLTHDGRYLLVASGSGAAVINVAGAEQGSPGAVIGTLSSPGGRHATQVTVSPDDRFAFVTLENSNHLAVFNLRGALADGFAAASLVGTVRLGVRPAGMRVSSDGRWLYVASEMRSGSSQQGTLDVLNLRKAETNPAASVAAVVNAGCGPVRVINSADSSVVWVTARTSDAVLGFSAAKLLSDPQHALVARVQVGEAPYGLTFVDHGKRIVVANSNVFGVQGATPDLAVIDTAAALAGRPALLGRVNSGQLPRQFTVEPDGRTLLITNSSSRQLEAVKVGDLP